MAGWGNGKEHREKSMGTDKGDETRKTHTHAHRESSET